MRLPIVQGLIDRRILANFHIDPEVLARILPPPFKPQIVNGKAIAGICLIRLKQERPRSFPSFLGFASENAAHRFAVEWEEQGTMRTGVYIPRRDTSSRLMSLLGGRLFPGVQHFARFEVKETSDCYSVSVSSSDGRIQLTVQGRIEEAWPGNSAFDSREEASQFFRCGSVGYSSTCKPGVFDGMELCSESWHVDALKIDRIESSYFNDRNLFPAGSVEFDCALLMRNIAHEWQSRPTLNGEERCIPPIGSPSA